MVDVAGRRLVSTSTGEELRLAAVAAAGLPVRIEGLSLRDAFAAMAGDKKAEAGSFSVNSNQ